MSNGKDMMNQKIDPHINKNQVTWWDLIFPTLRVLTLQKYSEVAISRTPKHPCYRDEKNLSIGGSNNSLRISKKNILNHGILRVPPHQDTSGKTVQLKGIQVAET